MTAVTASVMRTGFRLLGAGTATFGRYFQNRFPARFLFDRLVQKLAVSDRSNRRFGTGSMT